MLFPKINSEKDFDALFSSEIWLDAAREICKRHRVSFKTIERAGGSEHIVFFVDDVFVLKIYRPYRACFEREVKALEIVGGKIDLATPEIVARGKFEQFDYVLMTQIPGRLLTRAEWLKFNEKRQIPFFAKLAAAMKQIHSLDSQPFENNWAEFVADRAATFIERQTAHGVNAEIIEVLPAYLEENLKLVPTNAETVFMHADTHFGNLGVTESGENLEIGGLFDFADSRRGFYEYDFLAVGVLMIQGQRNLQREFFRAYGYAESELNEEMRRRLTMLYETADLRRYALRLKPEAVEYTLDELERGIWSFA